MSPEELIEYFDGVTATARAMGVEPPSVSEWRARGKVPPGRQFQAQVLTDGKLTADPIEPKGASNKAFPNEAAA